MNSDEYLKIIVRKGMHFGDTEKDAGNGCTDCD